MTSKPKKSSGGSKGLKVKKQLLNLLGRLPRKKKKGGLDPDDDDYERKRSAGVRRVNRGAVKEAAEWRELSKKLICEFCGRMFFKSFGRLNHVKIFHAAESKRKVDKISYSDYFRSIQKEDLLEEERKFQEEMFESDEEFNDYIDNVEVITLSDEENDFWGITLKKSLWKAFAKLPEFKPKVVVQDIYEYPDQTSFPLPDKCDFYTSDWYRQHLEEQNECEIIDIDLSDSHDDDDEKHDSNDDDDNQSSSNNSETSNMRLENTNGLPNLTKFALKTMSKRAELLAKNKLKSSSSSMSKSIESIDLDSDSNSDSDDSNSIDSSLLSGSGSSNASRPAEKPLESLKKFRWTLIDEVQKEKERNNDNDSDIECIDINSSDDDEDEKDDAYSSSRHYSSKKKASSKKSPKKQKTRKRFKLPPVQKESSSGDKVSLVKNPFRIIQASRTLNQNKPKVVPEPMKKRFALSIKDLPPQNTSTPNGSSQAGGTFSISNGSKPDEAILPSLEELSKTIPTTTSVRLNFDSPSRSSPVNGSESLDAVGTSSRFSLGTSPGSSHATSPVSNGLTSNTTSLSDTGKQPTLPSLLPQRKPRTNFIQQNLQSPIGSTGNLTATKISLMKTPETAQNKNTFSWSNVRIGEPEIIIDEPSTSKKRFLLPNVTNHVQNSNNITIPCSSKNGAMASGSNNVSLQNGSVNVAIGSPVSSESEEEPLVRINQSENGKNVEKQSPFKFDDLVRKSEKEDHAQEIGTAKKFKMPEPIIILE